MPIIPFKQLPDSSRIWIFASDRELKGAPAESMLAAVDRFLAEWRAHGVPLRCGREWRDDRFLAVGVDVTQENASGCSIDGLFRAFQEVQREVGAQLVGGGRVFYRGANGIEAATREEFLDRVKAGDVSKETAVFDTSITHAKAWRAAFEAPAGSAWTRRFFERR